MSVNDLPIYPTPQQASYVIGSNNQAKPHPITPNSNNPTVYRPPPTKKYHGQANVNYNPQHNPPQYPPQHSPAISQQSPPQYHQQVPQQHQPQQHQQQHPQQQQHYQQQYQQPPPPPQNQQQYQPQSSQQYQPPQHNIQLYQPQPYQLHGQQGPPQHTDQQSLASTFNQVRISSQQSYQSPQPQQHPQAAAPAMQQQQSYNSSQQRPPQTSNHSSSSLHKKPPPEQRDKQKLKLDQELRQVFDKVDKNKSGRISARELSQALLNFDYTKFQDSTIILMIKLFSASSSDSSPSKHLNYDQFVSLWKHLSAYKKLFIQADTNNSGDISFGEFQSILEQMGYKLNIDLVLHLFQRFSYKNLDEFDAGTTVGKLKFDSFVELLVYLKKLTDVFKKYDKDLKGVATIGFSDFLHEVSNLT